MELIFMTEVTCLYCKQKIYKEDENTVRVGTRYAHKECAEKGAKKKQAKEAKENKPKEKTETKKANLKKCLYCGKDIDISKEEYCMARTNRYAHKSCYEKNYSPDEEYIKKIYSFLKEEMGISYDYPQCERQRLHFIQKMGYTNEGILNALRYFYLVKKQSPEKSGNRIGIVPYVYNEAKEYYENMEKSKKKIQKSIQKQLEQKVRHIKVGGHEEEFDRGLIDLDEIGGE